MTASEANNEGSPPASGAVRIPDAPALALRAGRGCLVRPDGTVETVTPAEAVRVLEGGEVLLAHGGFTARRLGRHKPARRTSLFEVMELFAFARPARACLPTAGGLAAALDLDPPTDIEDEAVTLIAAAHALLTELSGAAPADGVRLADLAAAMGQGGWAWAPLVLAALGKAPPGTAFGGLDTWTRLPEWTDRAPQGGASSVPVTPEEAQARLGTLLGAARRVRPGQDRYVEAATAAFQPREDKDSPLTVLAEAGTGIGKTLGYLAPASAWAEANGPGTWISTYTKNLQRQLDQEMEAVYPDAVERRRRAVVRKGRENYLCLLNFEDAVRRARSSGGEDIVTLALVARWLEHSRDGDMIGGDFPAWLMPQSQIQGAFGQPGLTDRRGECLYSACSHYRKCTIEKVVRRARHAHLVIANHALVMTQSALDHALAQVRRPSESEPNGAERRVRVVFDESHHLFDAADSAFGATLSAQEAGELRRWVRGPETRGRRGRGLAERIGDLLDGDGDTGAALAECQEAARALPREGWTGRQGEDTPSGAAERFFAAVRRHVEARAERSDSPDFTVEATCDQPDPDLLANAGAFADALAKLGAPLLTLSKALRTKLEEEAEDLDTATRARIEAISRGLDRRGALMIPAWRTMLASLARGGGEPGMVDWFALDRFSGRVINIAMHRRHLDPMTAFAEGVAKPLHGMVLTSASLSDVAPGAQADEDPALERADDGTRQTDWEFARLRTGVRHLPEKAVTTADIPSPFDYADRTRIFIVQDLAAKSMEQVAGAYRALFEASGGGALGLFTAIARLRAVHGRIAQPLEAAGLPLYAQHVDAMDVGTLVDIFRAETHACLLGTDAVRDGVDVPGQSLRLIVFDRVPWPRPDLLHKARRAHFGARSYDEALTRLRLKQAYGRLIRGPEDRGVFVMLDNRTPTRLLTAFPDGVPVERLGLKDVIKRTKDFLAEMQNQSTSQPPQERARGLDDTISHG